MRTAVKLLAVFALLAALCVGFVLSGGKRSAPTPATVQMQPVPEVVPEIAAVPEPVAAPVVEEEEAGIGEEFGEPEDTPRTFGPDELDEYGRPVLDLSRLAGTLKLTVPGLSGSENRLPLVHSCYRANTSPALKWAGAPPGTKSYALFLERRMKGKRPLFTWIVFGIPGDSAAIPGNLPKRAALEGAMRHALSDHDTAEYVGPCEPRGKIEYVFRLFALDSVPALPPGVPSRDLMRAMNGHIVDMSEVRVLHYLRF